MYATLDHVTDAAANIQTFYFQPLTPVHYTAGEFIEMYLPHDHADNRGQKHWFTLSSSPTEALISITTKFAERSSTFKQALRKLQPGDKVMFSEPMGDFVLPKDKTIPLVFVAGGIGVTPMHSITQWLHDTGEQRSATLFYAANKEEELAFVPLFEQYYASEFIPVISQPKDSWLGKRGPITAEMILRASNPTERTMFYLSGPEPMVQAIEKDLRTSGVDRHRIITDYFPGYPST